MLADLSEAELCVLGVGNAPPVIDAELIEAWNAARPEDIQALAAAVVQLLEERGLAMVEGSGPGNSERVRLRLLPEVAFVVAARLRPAAVVVCEDESGDSVGAPRLFGLAEEGGRVELAVVELRTRRRLEALGAVRSFGLVSTGQAGRPGQVGGAPGCGRRAGFRGRSVAATGDRSLLSGGRRA